jgi:two-component system sensor histidine kinase/response regulator
MSELAQCRLLVVDDEVPLMTALRNTLRDEGYQTTGARSGAEALALLQAGEFDVIMTDLLMPEMDGITLLRQALVLDPNLVGIVMTGHGSIPTAVEAMKAGAIDYVLKPFKLSTALPALQRALVLRHLRLRNAELEERVRQRTVELEAANHELDAFCHSVSHDLRTPLRALAGFAEILYDHHAASLPPEVRRLIDLMHASAAEMDKLTGALLDFSRQGRRPITLQPVDLQRLCGEVIKDFKGESGHRQVEFKLQPLPNVLGDPVLLRLALMNLLSNALKYTRPREWAVIEIGTTRLADESAQIIFIRDNGVGFDPNSADKLFEVFQRLHHVTEFEGNGVGLAIVRRIIEGHGGRIWAEAAPDAGATFFFTLPAESAAAG